MIMLPPKIKGVVRPNEKKQKSKRPPSPEGNYPARGPKDKGGYMGNEMMVR